LGNYPLLLLAGDLLAALRLAGVVRSIDAALLLEAFSTVRCPLGIAHDASLGCFRRLCLLPGVHLGGGHREQLVNIVRRPIAADDVLEALFEVDRHEHIFGIPPPLDGVADFRELRPALRLDEDQELSGEPGKVARGFPLTGALEEDADGHLGGVGNLADDFVAIAVIGLEGPVEALVDGFGDDNFDCTTCHETFLLSEKS
jgi:hypothetical protein